MGSLGREELSLQVASLRVGIAALASLAELELCVRRQQTLMVGRALRGFLAAGLKEVSMLS